MLNTFKLEERSLEYLLSQFHLITGCEALWPQFSPLTDLRNTETSKMWMTLLTISDIGIYKKHLS